MAANIYNMAAAQFAQAQTCNIKTSKVTLNNHQLHSSCKKVTRLHDVK